MKTQARPPVHLIALIALMVVLWALSFIAGKLALREIPALMLPGLRTTIAAACLLPLYLRERRRAEYRPLQRTDAPQLAAVAICGVTLNQFFFITGLSRTSVGHAAVVIALTPILVLGLASAVGQEKITVAKLGGMLIALVGVAVLQTAKSPGMAATLFGDVLMFLGALAFAIYSVVGKQVSPRYSSITINTLSYSIGALTLLPLSLWKAPEVKLASISGTAWLGLLFMAVFSSVIAYLIYYHALTLIPASRVAAFSYFQPVLATLLAFLLLGEPVTRSLFAGGSLVLIGVWAAERGE